MRFRRYGAFTGGIDLPDKKLATAGHPIRRWRKPEFLRVPLAPAGAPPARPLVEPGRRVERGERIAAGTPGKPGGVDIFAPLGGRVESITTADVPGEGGFVSQAAVELTDLETPRGPEPVEDRFDFSSADDEELLRRIASGGLTTYRLPVCPLAAWVERARHAGCRLLAANVMEGQPYVTADHRVLIEYADQVAGGLAILGRAIGVEEIVLAVDQRRTGLYDAVVAGAGKYNITRIALPHKYPTGADVILAKVLTRREAPLGSGPVAAGVAVIDASTCMATWRWVVGSQRPDGRVVTIAGERVPEPGNFYVPFGTPCAPLPGAAQGPLIHGGPMVGLRCTDRAVVTPATDAVLAIREAPPAVPGTCIRCGWCTDYCPARLNVAAMNDAFELVQFDLAERLGVRACVGCGVCSYVCPARLPLSQRVRRLRQGIDDLARQMPLLSRRQTENHRDLPEATENIT